MKTSSFLSRFILAAMAASLLAIGAGCQCSQPPVTTATSSGGTHPHGTAAK